MKQKARQIDVATSAGVTRAVVSHVLHGGSGSVRVSHATAERVRSIAKELGYRPNASARNFRRKKTDTIGVLHGDGFPRLRLSDGSRYFALLMDGMIDGAFDHGYTLSICPKLFSETPEDSMADGRFDGLLWYSTFPSEKNFLRLQQCSIPIVLIHCRAEDFEYRIPTVICDNELGIRLALEHLAELGHRKIGFAYPADCAFGESMIRFKCFISLGNSMGLDVSPVDVCSDLSGLRRYAEAPSHTAIIGHNEQLAIDVMTELQRNGFRIPEDISIVGFDSTDYCKLCQPHLTSVSQPLSSIGYRAVEMLSELIAGQTPSPFESVLECGFDIRNSTSRVSMVNL